ASFAVSAVQSRPVWHPYPMPAGASIRRNRLCRNAVSTTCGMGFQRCQSAACGSWKVADFRQKRRAQDLWIIGTIIIGLLAGIVAKLLMPGRDPGGFIITTLLGIAGAFVATWLGQAIGWYEQGQAAGFI